MTRHDGRHCPLSTNLPCLLIYSTFNILAIYLILVIYLICVSAFFRRLPRFFIYPVFFPGSHLLCFPSTPITDLPHFGNNLVFYAGHLPYFTIFLLVRSTTYHLPRYLLS